MRRVLVLLIVFSAVSAYSQKKVSEEFASYKLRMDSLMRVTYGDTLFEKYFVFDENSYIWVDGHTMHSWNDTYTGDSVTSVEFWYVFVYPGALINGYRGYRPGSTVYWVFEDSLTNYTRHCIAVDPAKVAKITEEHLKHPLKECTVRLYTERWYSADRKSVTLDSTHAYIEVEYEYTKGGKHRGDKFKTWTYRILIDACTGEFIGKNESLSEGTKGGKF
jgi:hypothetical protein